MFKRTLILAFASFFTLGLFARQYQITQINYTLEGNGAKIFGRTQPYALENNVPVEKNQIFETEEELNEYILEYTIKLNNLRAFEKIEVTYETAASDSGEDTQPAEDEICPVTLNVSVKDSFHLFAMPGPKYDSNTGLTFKLKVKDTNFLGSLNTFSSDFYFLLPTDESDGSDTKFGLDFNIDYPFKAGIFDALWLNDFNFSYTLGDELPEWNIGTGIRFTLPFEKNSLVLEMNQKFVNNYKYQNYGDNIYFVDDIKFSVPVIVTKLNYFGNILYTPYASFSANWDFDYISKINSDLSSPIFTVGHELSFGRIDWMQNFRTGLTFSLDNYYSYNLQRQRFYPIIEVESKAFAHAELLQDYNFLRNIGVAADVRFFTYLYNPNKDEKYINDGKSIGSYLRGIRDSQIYAGRDDSLSSLTPTSAFILNLDFPVNIITTDFTKSFMRYFNFEMQVSPFIDFALCYNKITHTFCNLKDGFYAGGVEVIVYPLKWSGITIRASVGMDIGRKFFSDKINMDWREDLSMYEFSFGFGLHY